MADPLEIFRINKHDDVCYANANWQTFAKESGGYDASSSIMDKPLWDFISGSGTQQFYQLLIDRVRLSKLAINSIQMRCDSPTAKRFIEMEIVPLEDGTIEFKSKLLRQEPRDHVDLLRGDVKPPQQFLKACSYCKKIAVIDDVWVEVEEAIVKLDLLSKPDLPQLTHGICLPCYQVAKLELEKIKQQQKMADLEDGI